jgi:2-haloacid dehalogenase
LNSKPRKRIPVTIKALVFDAYGTLFDIQSVAAITDEAFPGYGEIITQVWRLKQLEYTWLRSLMGRYQDFSVITRESLSYTLRILGLKHDATIFERIMDKYVHLDLYPDARPTLKALKHYKLAILSNGSTDMLTTLVRNTGLDTILDATISVDACGIFKPSPEPYRLVEGRLNVKPAEVLFVSSNPWGRDRRKIGRAERRLDRESDTGGDGAGLPEERPRRAADHVQGHSDADGRTRSCTGSSHQWTVRPHRTAGVEDGVTGIHAPRAVFSDRHIVREFGTTSRTNIW